MFVDALDSANAVTPTISAPIMIASPEHLRSVAQVWEQVPLLAVDTESNSLFAYKERVCLIQVSTRETDWLIDPLIVTDLEPLRPIFSNPAIEKVFHAAEYDLMCMKRDFGFTFANLFDTMFAARLVGRKAFGLGALLGEFFAIQTDKRFQRADWSLRPLPADQLQYAQQDTHYLPALRDYLAAEIVAAGRQDEANEVFEALTQVQAAVSAFDADGFWRINSARDFNRRQMAVLRELYLLRDELARRRDNPPFKIMGDDTLTALVLADPHTTADLFAGRELSPNQARRYGGEILAAIARGQNAKLPPRPQRPGRVDPMVQARYDALHQWRKVRAQERGVESDIILGKEAMWALARNPPTHLHDLTGVPGLGDWRRGTYGNDLIRIVNEAQPTPVEDSNDDAPESEAV